MQFHVEWNEEHLDWQCRCGIAVGVGATPEEATLACIKDIGNGFSESIGWLGAPKPRKAVVLHAWDTWTKTWSAEFTDDLWHRGEYGWGDAPDDATIALMNRTDYRHGYSY